MLDVSFAARSTAASSATTADTPPTAVSGVSGIVADEAAVQRVDAGPPDGTRAG